MDDLESRLDHQLSGLARVPLAEPEPVAGLRRRARRVRVGRSLTGLAAIATTAVVIGAVVVGGRSTDRTAPRKVQVAAPSFVLGDIDAVVLSSNFDPDGSRESFPPAVAASVGQVPGVQRVSGIVDTFAPIVENTGPAHYGPVSNGTPPRTPILFSYHDDDEVQLLTGRLPAAADEIIVDDDFVVRFRTDLGGTVQMDVGGDQPLTFRIVGTFELPGVELSGIPLAAMSAAHQSPQLPLNRLDVKLAAGADQANVRDAIATAVGANYTVAEPSVISFPDQRVAQLEIQHAYWALLSADPAERSQAVAGPHDPNSNAEYQQHYGETLSAELRVENVTFLSPDAATLTYRVFYGGSPSPIVNAPQSGAATRVDGLWKITPSTVCDLATADNLPCPGTHTATDALPPGWSTRSTLDPAVALAFTTLADPAATVDARVAAVASGASVRAEVAAGLQSDQGYAGKTTFSIVGWRDDGPARIEVLYTLATTDGPSTPWPTVATAEQAPDGHWYASTKYACGMAGLASGACVTNAAPGPLGTHTVLTVPAAPTNP